MRTSVRKFFGAALIATIAVFVLAPAVAGAQTTTTTFVPGEGAPPVPGDCTFSVTPNPVAALPANVTIEGTAPAGVTVEMFVNGSTTASASQVLPDSPDPGTFSFPLTVTTDNTQVDVNYTYGQQNAYVQGCTDVAGTVVTRITVQTAGNEASRLAFTGSDSTPTFVIIGGVAIVIGLVLVVAARRRAKVNG